MPVVVTGAELPLGRAVVLALLASGAPDVRAVVRDRSAAGVLRAAGARVAVGDLSDPLRLGAVLEGAHTVVHLDTGATGTGTPADTWQWLAEAAEDTGVRRVVTVLPPGASPPAPEGEAPAWEVVVVPRERLAGHAEEPGAADGGTVREILRADARR